MFNFHDYCCKDKSFQKKEGAIGVVLRLYV